MEIMENQEKYPNTIEITSVNDEHWNDPNKLKILDEDLAQFTALQGFVADYLDIKNFGFTIPSNATINGIEYNIYAKPKKLTYCDINLIYNGNSIGEIKSGYMLPDGDGWQTLGGQNDTWEAELTPAIINDITFGINQEMSGGEEEETTYKFDAVKLTIYYITPTKGEPLAKNQSKMSGYNLFCKAYINSKIKSETPRKLPDGTLFD